MDSETRQWVAVSGGELRAATDHSRAVVRGPRQQAETYRHRLRSLRQGRLHRCSGTPFVFVSFFLAKRGPPNVSKIEEKQNKPKTTNVVTSHVHLHLAYTCPV